MEKLLTGVAYHGNRILKHVEEDMIDIVNHNMNLVVHMFTHNDWDRHLKVMKDIVNITKYYGLDMWIDNWGIGGPPGDKSFFTGKHPEIFRGGGTGGADTGGTDRICSPVRGDGSHGSRGADGGLYRDAYK